MVRILEYGAGYAVAYAGQLAVTSGIGEVTMCAGGAGIVADGAGTISATEIRLRHGKTHAVTLDALKSDAAPFDAALLSDVADYQHVARWVKAAGVVVALGRADGSAAPAFDMLLAAKSGLMALTGAPTREPLYGVGRRISYAIGLYAYCALLVELRNAVSGELGPRLVRVDEDAAVLSLGDAPVCRATYGGVSPVRTGRYESPRQPSGMFKAADGYVCLMPMIEREWQRVAMTMGMEDLLADARFATEAGRLENRAELEGRVSAWLQDKTLGEILDIASREAIPCAPALDARAAVRLLEADSRSFGWQAALWREPREVTPDAGGASAAGSCSGSTGGDGEQVEAIGRLDAGRAWAGATRSVRPLEGVRVIEFTTGWAGPLAGRILAGAGAEVIKIESAAHMDMWRGPSTVTVGLDRYPDCKAPANEPWNCCGLFNTENRGKLSARVNLRRPEARELIGRLIEKSDIVIENHRPGVMASLGLDFASLRELRHDIIALSISAVTEHSALTGWGPCGEALSGMCALMGYPTTNEPCNTSYGINDALTGLWGAAKVLTALEMNQRPVHVKTSLVGAAVATFLEPLLDDAWAVRMGNGHPEVPLHGCFLTEDDDRWVAIVCPTTEVVTALMAVLGCTGALADDTLARDAEIARRTLAWQPEALVAALRSAGVPCQEVRRLGEVVQDPEYWARGILTRVEHPLVGARLYPELAIPTAGELTRQRAPLFGEDDETVWKQIVGLDSAAFEKALRDGVIG